MLKIYIVNKILLFNLLHIIQLRREFSVRIIKRQIYKRGYQPQTKQVEKKMDNLYIATNSEEIRMRWSLNERPIHLSLLRPDDNYVYPCNRRHQAAF